MENPPNLANYDGNGYPDEHVELVNEQLSYFSVDDALKCIFFVLPITP